MAFRMIRASAREDGSEKKQLRRRSRLNDHSSSLFQKYRDRPELAKISVDKSLSADDKRIAIGKAILRGATRDVMKEYDFDDSDKEDGGEEIVPKDDERRVEKRKRKLEEFLTDDVSEDDSDASGDDQGVGAGDMAVKRARLSLLEGAVHSKLTQRILTREGKYQLKYAAKLKEILGTPFTHVHDSAEDEEEDDDSSHNEAVEAVIGTAKKQVAMDTDSHMDSTTEIGTVTKKKKETQSKSVLKTKVAEELRSNCILVKQLRGGHRLAATCVVVSKTADWCVTGSKDGSLIKWCLKSGRRLRRVWHAWPMKRGRQISMKALKAIRPKPVLCLAMCPEEKYLLSGGEDCLIRVWNAQTLDYKATFRGHLAAVTGMAVSSDLDFGHEDEYEDDDGVDALHSSAAGAEAKKHKRVTLFSTGADRQVRVYDLYQMGFAEPLYGHTLGINAISSTSDERCLTVSDDRTIRYWRLKTQSQLIFKGAHSGMVDACTLVTPSMFVTGSSDGSIALWNTQRKKQLFILKNAHATEKGARVHWITALAARPNSDVFASGAGDGVVRIWSLSSKAFTLIRSVQIPKGGFVNAMQWSDSGDILVCAIGNELRLGRWERVKGARNGLFIIKLPVSCAPESAPDSDTDESIDDGASEQKAITMQFTEAVAWDRWDPREKGDFSMVESAASKTKKSAGKSTDSKKDEWSNFFGKLYGDS